MGTDHGSTMGVALAATLFLGLTFIILLFKKKDAKPMSSWPPGPRKLPIIGNLHQLSKGGPLVHITLAEMAKQYGKIMTVWFGPRPSIVVTDYGSAWEVLVTKSSDFASRSMPYRSRFTSADWRTLSTSDFSDAWYTLRKGAQSSFFHPPNVSAQIPVQESNVDQLIRSIGEEAAKNNGVVRPLPHIRKNIVRLIARLCFGPDFRDEKFVEAMDVMIEDTILQTGPKGLVDLFPLVLQHIPGFKRPFREIYEVKRRIEELIRPCIDRYSSSSSKSDQNKYYYFQFLLSQGFPQEVVIFNVFEMFLLAVDSTSLTIAWALGFLIHDPQIQAKLYKEVNNIGEGQEGVLGIEQVSKMKYLQGVVKESARMRPIAPLGIPHKAVKDTTLTGTRINAGTSVIVNLYALLHDPEVWKEPNRFNPERFLENIGKPQGHEGEEETAMERSFLPFGGGRRICAGMELAKPHVALTLGNLVKAFEWSSAIEGKLPDISEDSTFVLGMKTPLLARVVPRHTS